MTLAGRRVVLGVSGGIACYKSCTIARRLAEAGAMVDVVLTPSAGEFVRPVVFEALTGRPVLLSLWAPGHALDHIHLAREAEVVAVAPATANLLARAAQGVTDDLLTAILLARTGPVLVAPAMNDHMFAHPATQRNLILLKERGWVVIGPVTGALAEGPGELAGRMAEPEEIVAHVERLLRREGSRLAGRKVVVTAGPTREPIDSVRVITNRSSGRMGYALAAAAFARGAEVILITGPSRIEAPTGVTRVPVESTEELQTAVGRHLRGTSVLLMAAAPADFRTRGASRRKRPRSEGPIQVTLEPTPDVLASTLKQRPKRLVAVGFALETGHDLAHARAKLRSKHLDLIVLNDATEPGAGFEAETNRVTLVSADGATPLPLLSKREVAEQILDAVERLA